MFLNKIEITGFKSFAKKTSLDFFDQQKKGSGPQITAIVGPNGSGKSNIIDALRWVLGEQSMKAVRGKKTEDVIFAGSDRKVRLSMAHVAIYINNEQGLLPTNFREVVIERRLYRSGESEYLLNGAKVRLMDLTDFLLKVGIGKKSYSIVNQGMADSVVQATPYERRLIIEEAAGIKKSQLKKEQSLKKIAKAKDNLVKIKALIAEIEPHLKNLKRQYNKAHKKEHYELKLKQKQRQFFSVLWSSLQQEKEKLSSAQEKKAQEVAKIENKLKAIDQKLAALPAANANLDKELDTQEKKRRQKEQQVSQIEKELLIIEGKIELEKERIANIKTTVISPLDMVTIKGKVGELKKMQQVIVKELSLLDKIETKEQRKDFQSKIKQVLEKINELHSSIVAGKIEKKRSAKEINQEKQVFLDKIEQFKQKQQALAKKKSDIEQVIKTIKARIEKLVKNQKQDRQARLELESSFRRVSFDLSKSKEVLDEGKLQLAKLELREEEFIKRLEKETKLQLKELAKTTGGADLNQLQSEIFKLENSLRQIGAIDEMITKEYEETQTRYDFLTKESADLIDTIAKLEKVITEMEHKIKTDFEKAFTHINRKFNYYFKVMFGGGKAELKRVNFSSVSADEEISEEKESVGGIEIWAQPPDKKINNLSMLSGGERTLIAIAFLLALISYNKPPFVVLDEVEAALDEANSRRFNKVLQDLTQKSNNQFILVTHNRETMQNAGLLYGVSMDKDGVSNLLSIRLE